MAKKKVVIKKTPAKKAAKKVMPKGKGKMPMGMGGM